MKSSLKDLSEVEISLDSTLSFILFKKKLGENHLFNIFH